MKNVFSKILLSLLLLAALALQGCGHKGPPIPPGEAPEPGNARSKIGPTLLVVYNYWA